MAAARAFTTGKMQVSLNPKYRIASGLARLKEVIGIGSFRRARSSVTARPSRLSEEIRKWSLTRLQQRLVKTGGRLIKHARYYWLMLAESHLTRRLFVAMLRKIGAAGAGGIK